MGNEQSTNPNVPSTGKGISSLGNELNAKLSRGVNYNSKK